MAEAIGLARDLGDRWRLSQILVAQVVAALAAHDPIAARAAAEEGRDLANAIGDRFDARRCRWYLGIAQLYQGDLAGAVAQFAAVADEAEAAHDEIWRVDSLVGLGIALAHQGDYAAARAAADAAVEATAELGGLKAGAAYHVLAVAALAAGDATTAQDATEAGRPLASAVPQAAGLQRVLSAEAALAGGDLVAARRWADDAVSTKTGSFLSDPLTTRARVAIAQGEPDQAERDAHDALARAAEVEAYLFIPDILECLAVLAGEPAVTAKPHACSARHTPSVNAWARSASRSMTPATKPRWRRCEMPWARKTLTRRGPRARRCPPRRRSPTPSAAVVNANDPPAAGPHSRRPSVDVVRLVSEGLSNNDIATRLFVSPRTVQTHLTHVYTKLSLTSRVQLVQEAARHT